MTTAIVNLDDTETTWYPPQLKMGANIPKFAGEAILSQRLPQVNTNFTFFVYL
jgi:hypothetical protein